MSAAVGVRESNAAVMRERRRHHKRDDVIKSVIQNCGVGTGFWERVDKSGDCWLYNGPRDRDGYGKFSWRYAYFAAHRFAYLALIGPIADGLTLDHICHNSASCDPCTCTHRRCVNPAHLVAVPHALNASRAARERRLRPARMTPNNIVDRAARSSGGSSVAVGEKSSRPVEESCVAGEHAQPVLPAGTQTAGSVPSHNPTPPSPNRKAQR